MRSFVAENVCVIYSSSDTTAPREDENGCFGVEIDPRNPRCLRNHKSKRTKQLRSPAGTWRLPRGWLFNARLVESFGIGTSPADCSRAIDLDICIHIYVYVNLHFGIQIRNLKGAISRMVVSLDESDRVENYCTLYSFGAQTRKYNNFRRIFISQQRVAKHDWDARLSVSRITTYTFLFSCAYFYIII